jgi:polysaccharide export outer membrane protein
MQRHSLEKRRTMLILLVLTALQAAPAAAADPALYIVGPNDVLNITVFNQPQMSGKFVVESDGTLAFPLVGRVAVGGLSIRAVEDEVRRRLSAGYLTDPRVTVAVEQYRSQQIFVMGEVKQPGPLQFTGAMTLIEALARVGSTTDRAGAEAMIVRPSNPGAAAPTPQGANAPNSETIHVNLLNLQAGTLSENVALRAGDTIFVPRVATVFVSGQVKSAGEYPLRPRMTVRQAVALAGGVTERGSNRRIQIVREVKGTDITIDVNLETAVQPGDTIVVRERFM